MRAPSRREMASLQKAVFAILLNVEGS